MSKVIRSRRSPHRWRDKTRRKIEERVEYNWVTYLTTRAQEQFSTHALSCTRVIVFTNGFVLK